MAKFSNGVALVTGGGSGIGEAICRTLARYGVTVAVSDINGEAAERVATSLRAEGATAQGYRHNVTSAEDSRRVVEAIEGDLGPIGILVNNAGVTKVIDFLDLDEAEWDRVIDVNLKGVFLTSKAVLPGMIARRSGRIVNMSSICGKMAFEGFSHYTTSKFGVIGLTQAIACEVAKHDITVNAVCPGVVETPLQDVLTEDMAKGSPDMASAADAKNWITSLVPLGRWQPPEDIAEMVAFLASDLGRNMTGGSYHVDGGIAPR